MTFHARLATNAEKTISTALVAFDEADLMAGDVEVAIDCSTVNDKGALAMRGHAPVIQRFPLIPGIDFAGTVTAPSHPGFQADDRVVANVLAQIRDRGAVAAFGLAQGTDLPGSVLQGQVRGRTVVDVNA